MDNFCRKCNSPLNPQTGLCPNCTQHSSGKKKNTGLIITACILAFLVALTITFVALAHFDVIDVDLPYETSTSQDEKDKSEPQEGKSEGAPAGSSKTQSKQVVGLSEGFHNFTADITDILAGEEQTVTFSIEYEGEDDIGSDELAIYDEEDTFITYLADNGKNGDDTSGDGTYSGQHTISTSEIGGHDYYVAYETKDEESVPLTISVYRDLTSDDFNGFKDLLSEMSSLDFDDAKKYAENSDLVKDLVVDKDEKTILYTSVYDITGLWHEDLGSDIKGSGASAVPKDNGIDYYTARSNALSLDITSPINNTDVASVRPFNNSNLRYNDFYDAGSILANSLGGSHEDYWGSRADLNAFAELGKYGIALIDSHSLLCKSQTYIVTGQYLSNYDFLSGDENIYVPDIVAGNIVFTNDSLAAVNGKFLTRTLDPGALEGSIWYLGICNGMANDSISKALLDRGAYSAVGFTDKVSVDYCNEVLFETFINSMLLSSETLKNSIEAATEIYGKSDSSNSGCKVKTVGSSGYRISKNEVVNAEREVVLVLDYSGSMSGTPLEETKKAAKEFIDSTVDEDVAVAAVRFDSSSRVISNFSQNNDKLKSKIDAEYTGGGTDTESGLVAAEALFKSSKAKKKIIVLMTDGEANEGKTGDDLIAYANTLKDQGITIYTLGFFHQLSDKTSVQALLEGIASEGCHYEVENAEDLQFFFGDIADVISGQRYIYIRIACPVDVSVRYDGDKLSSGGENPSTRTDFGTLTFEDNGTSDKIKILRLKEGPDYDIEIEGTGRGKMDYTIQYMDEDGEYADKREFKNIDITKRTEIATVAATENIDKTVLKIDEDGDGKYDITMEAGPNERGKEIDPYLMLKIILKAVGGIVILVIAIILFVVIRKKVKAYKAMPKAPKVPIAEQTNAVKSEFCTNCGAPLDPSLNFCSKCAAKIKK